MKTLARILWVLTLVFLTANIATAQVYAGVRAGIGLAKWHYDVPDEVSDAINDDQQYLVTPYIAIPLELQVTENFALQPELVYIQKGSHEKSEFVEAGTYRHEMDCRTRINYLALPVLGKAMYQTESLDFFIIAGPQIGYALNGKYKVEETITNGSQETNNYEETIDFDEDDLDRLDFGVVFGGGVGIAFGPGKVVADARYDLGLNNLSTIEDSDFKIFDRTFGFSVGYMIPIGQ